MPVTDDDNSLDGAQIDASELDIQTVNVLGKEPITFQHCYKTIKELYEKTDNELDSMMKLDAISSMLMRYFQCEDVKDVLEGFLHLVYHLDRLSTEISKQHDLSLVKVTLVAFYNFVKDHPFLASSTPIYPVDDSFLLKVLEILTALKMKHVGMISEVLRLKDNTEQRVQTIVQRAIGQMLDAGEGEMVKAVAWMTHLNLRDHFDFEKIICTLVLDNQTAMIDMFVGEEPYRRKKFIHYLDKLIELNLKRRNGINELENRLLQNKLLEKVATRYHKKYEMNEAEVPNLMVLRARNALQYHHVMWQNNEMTWENFEELATHAMTNPQVRDFYLSLICNRGMCNRALHFAMRLRLPREEYVEGLRIYCDRYPHEVQAARAKYQREFEMRRRNQELEKTIACEVHPGYPIITADTWEEVEQLIEVLRGEEETLIGIDAEWRPHFLSTHEQIALIQVATSKGVYLVDVLVLMEKHHLDNNQWLNFFDALLCTKHANKIGYDFRNDMRVLLSTFPFLADILPNVTKVFCMYRLLTSVATYPDANQAIFKSKSPANLSLSGVTEFFLDMKLEKGERIGNWSQRPLRLEQKKYAALDAYCLVKIYQIVAPRIKTLGDKNVATALRNLALIKYEKEQPKPQPTIPGVDGPPRQPKENEQQFYSNVQKGCAALAGSAANDSTPCKSIDDVRFVADSMLFGLGKQLRKCGFDTRLMSDRNKIVDFCNLEENHDFIVLSTGRGHKALSQMLPDGRCICVPITTNGTTPPSMLVNHVMSELKILVRPEDMWSRCIECNQRAFVRVPKQIVKVLFFMNAVRLDCEWLNITKEDLDASVAEMRQMSALPFGAWKEEDENEYNSQKEMLNNEQFMAFESYGHDVIQCRHCSVDIVNCLVYGDRRDAPVNARVGLKLKKEMFEQQGTDIEFYVCGECGKLQYSSADGNEIDE